MELLSIIYLVVGIIYAIACLYWLIIQIRQYRKKSSSNVNHQELRPLPPLASKKPKGNAQANKRLWRELLTLTSGNRETVQRLIDSQRLTNPGQTETWYLEKVLSDLKRDYRT